jgi:hypothetical protein
MQLLFILLLVPVLNADLTSVKAETNLERRSDLALDYANAVLDAARDAYNSGDAAKLQAALDDAGSSVELSYQSLEETGKNARNNKHYKHAELRTRELLRRLDGLREMVGAEERSMVEKVRERVAEVHENLLKGIMSKRK